MNAPSIHRAAAKAAVAIVIEGTVARMTPAIAEALDEAMAFDDPRRHMNRAFQQGRWDGKVRLHCGGVFPAGLVHRLEAVLAQRGIAYQTQRPGWEEISGKNFGTKYLYGVTLRPEQVAGVQAALPIPMGRLDMPTGSGKTLVAAALAKYFWAEKGWRSLIITSRKGLAKKQARITREAVGDGVTVGQFGDGMKTRGQITCATGQSLVGFRERRTPTGIQPADPRVVELLENTDVLILDECHRGSGTTWYDFCLSCSAQRVYGMSGTAEDARDLKEARLEGICGRIIYRVSQRSLEDVKKLRRVRVAVVMSDAASGPRLPREHRTWRRPDGSEVSGVYEIPYADAYRLGVATNPAHNRTVVSATKWLLEKNRRPLVCCRSMAQFALLAKLLRAAGMTVGAVSGDSSTAVRDAVFARFTRRECQVLLAGTICDEGEDIPAVDSLVFGEGMRDSKITRQRVGRTVRMTEGGPDDAWVIDIAPTCHPTLLEHASARAGTYEAQGWDVKLVTEYDPEHPDFGL